MLCRLAAANANIREMLFLKRNATGLHATGRVLQLVLARAVAAPHSLDEAGLVLRNVEELLIRRRREGLLFKVLQRTLVKTVMHELVKVK